MRQQRGCRSESCGEKRDLSWFEVFGKRVADYRKLRHDWNGSSRYEGR